MSNFTCNAAPFIPIFRKFGIWAGGFLYKGRVLYWGAEIKTKVTLESRNDASVFVAPCPVPGCVVQDIPGVLDSNPDFGSWPN